MDATQVVIPMPLGHVMAFLIKGKRSILVDTGIPGSGQKILNALASNGLAPKDISLILITHCHSDHFGSLPAIQEKIGARVAIHKSEAEMLTQGVNAEICPVGLMGHIFAFLSKFLRQPKVAGIKPDILIDRELNLEEFGVQGKVIATPGHTAGSVSVILSSGEAMIGDMLMRFRKGALNYPIFAHDMTQVKKSLQLVLDHQPKQIYASHGGVFDAEVVLKSAGATRTVPLSQFVIGPYRTALGPGEILYSIICRKAAARTGWSYIKLGRRQAVNISRMTLAATIFMNGEGKIGSARLSGGSVFPAPSRIPRVERMLAGQIPSRELYREAASVAADMMINESGHRWSTPYKKPVLISLLTRALVEAQGKSKTGAVA